LLDPGPQNKHRTESFREGGAGVVQRRHNGVPGEHALQVEGEVGGDLDEEDGMATRRHPHRVQALQYVNSVVFGDAQHDR